MKATDLIKTNNEGVNSAAKLILDAVKDGSINHVAYSAMEVHPKSNDIKYLADWIFFMDTVNFSFWPDEGQKFDVTWNGKTYTGYFAACAAVNKALESGKNVINAKWMVTATLDQVNELFTTDSGHPIPLLEERVKAINDSGRVLLEKWNGTFLSCVEAANGSAQALLKIVVDNFESFRDVAQFRGKTVCILKRAQILVADVHGALEEQHSKGFKDIDILTMFADYRVPQALAYLGVLEYSPELLSKLGPGKRLEAGSEEEVAMRGASIWACELIVREMECLRGEDEHYKDVRKVPATEVDMFVWVYRRRHAKEIEEKIPFHRTRTIYY
ncbi:hypothetical protein WR25_24647 [Diploscapter pachys]|uniref:Queuosine 5'-phosphate N-glycosylase/hydrolase n=1 Tax=Diploscapter pachys TaxID=2018661 RepID=A0A2A2JUH5_9BILA|nr:hypothetical protein WR25_24647 [Diploscapter pachys]